MKIKMRINGQIVVCDSDELCCQLCGYWGEGWIFEVIQLSRSGVEDLYDLLLAN